MEEEKKIIYTITSYLYWDEQSAYADLEVIRKKGNLEHSQVKHHKPTAKKVEWWELIVKIKHLDVQDEVATGE